MERQSDDFLERETQKEKRIKIWSTTAFGAKMFTKMVHIRYCVRRVFLCVSRLNINTPTNDTIEPTAGQCTPGARSPCIVRMKIK